MEWGPRALGNRSILANPCNPNMKDLINSKIKRRESFRPFAPSIIKEEVSNWFEIEADVPYMSIVLKILKNKRHLLPAVTHVDYSARIQTVSEEFNKIYYDLLVKFKQETGCPVLVNTSFNVRGEPIVNTPVDAFNCFMGTNLDFLVIGNCILDKSKQNIKLKKSYIDNFELD